MTYFRTVYSALSSARLRFTVLFGMGRRGSKRYGRQEFSCVDLRHQLKHRQGQRIWKK